MQEKYRTYYREKRLRTQKLDDADIPLIRALHTDDMQQIEIAEKFEVHKSTINKIVRGKIWRNPVV